MLLHPAMVSSTGIQWEKPSSKDAWNEKPSMKLQTLVETVHYHLASNGRSHVKITDDGKTLLLPTTTDMNPINDDAPDKIVVFSNFPSSNIAIGDVSKLLPACLLHRLRYLFDRSLIFTVLSMQKSVGWIHWL